MGILVIREKVKPEQLREMLLEFQDDNYVKLAVNIEKGIVAGGGEWHADCEGVLLETEDFDTPIWGAGWLWESQEVTFDSLINIRPKLGNRTLELQDPVLHQQIQELVTEFFAGVKP